MAKRNGKPKDITSIADLTPDPRNARAHNPRNVGMIEAALGEVGAARSIVIDEDGVVLAGNATIDAAARAGIERVQVVDGDGETIIAVRRTGLTAAQKARLALYDNRAAELADWDAEVIAAIADEDAALLAGLFERDELADIMAQIEQPEPPGDPGAQVDRAEELREKWGTATGDLWALGEHRLVCSDCTDAAVVERVMGGERANMINTDPPYGVGYSGQSETMFYGHGATGKARTRILGDSAPSESRVILSAALCAITAPVLFLWAAPQFYLDAHSVVECAGYELFSLIVWNKNHANFGAMGARYKPKFEIALACKRDTIPWYGPNNEVTVWDIDRASANEFHPTQKPVELFERAIRNHTTPGAIVFDPFAGSGTTGVACERLGRKARMVEIDPGYCGVILQRFYDMTGVLPVRVE